MISIIIPVYNEEKILSENRRYFERLSKSAEVIYVDGGSDDLTREYASKYGRLLSAPKSRAMQMNVGAKAACHDILLFLHADSSIDPKILTVIEDNIKQEGHVGGCLRQVLDLSHPIYKWIAWTGNMRAKMCHIYYGDQGIFVNKDKFWEAGAFPETAIGEDVLFSKRLRELGTMQFLSEPIRCSARRWQKQGILKTSLLNFKITLGLMMGQKLDRFAKLYQDVR